MSIKNNKNNKNNKRQKRALKTRSKINLLEKNRLTVFRSNSHIYAQIMGDNGSKVLVTASTLESDVKKENNGNIEAATEIGRLIAERAKEKGISTVAFDRSGYKYHGRVKALAEAAREAGLTF
jgi:large subunit ribosomal protein L18|tara:strand:- start:881 stop:1249 length:369 start_codon:yes stop_codon:yes gene_type:complete